MFVDKITTVSTITSAYIKHINGFKSTWITYLKNAIIKIYLAIDYSNKYVIWYLISSRGDCLGL